MELYLATSYQLAERLTNEYSTSFSLSSRLFESSIRRHIYAIYGFVRIADEIVDTYKGPQTAKLLDELEAHVFEQLSSSTPFSANPIVHAFVATAQQFHIDATLIRPFFESMRADITTKKFSQASYEAYIYGSAEVIGLMCLRVFTDGDTKAYNQLETGARALGSAYQKVNFLRDMKADFNERGRCYFPQVDFEHFTDAQKEAIEQEIEHEFLLAHAVIPKLPKNARKAVATSYEYYWQLLSTLKKSSARDIQNKRIRVPSRKKVEIYLKAKVA